MRFLNRSPSILTSVTTNLLAITYQPKTHLHSHLTPQKANTALKGFIKSNSPTNALLLFRSLWRKGSSSINSFSLLIVLKACTTRNSSAIHGKQIHAIIIKLGLIPIIFIRTILINFYSVMGNLGDAHQMFDEISERNIVSWTALISAYVNHGKPSKALKLFRCMQMEDVEPDQVTVTVALSACADLGALDMGEWIHAYVCRKQGFETDLCMNNALINMYAKCGDIESARRLFDKMGKRDVTTWTSMIVGHALHGQAQEGLRLFAEMEDMNKNMRKNKENCDHKSGLILPNDITFVGVLMACTHAGLVEEGWRHLKSMSKNYGLKPRISHFGCMVDLLCRAGLLNEAYSFIADMPIRPNTVVWRTLLSACSLHGNIELGEDVQQKLLELEPSHVSDDVIMSNTYAASCMWDKKLMVRDQIKQRRAPGCSSIEVGSEVHEFVATDKGSPLRRQIYEVLESLIKTMKAFGYAPELSSLTEN